MGLMENLQENMFLNHHVEVLSIFPYPYCHTAWKGLLVFRHDASGQSDPQLLFESVLSSERRWKSPQLRKVSHTYIHISYNLTKL